MRPIPLPDQPQDESASPPLTPIPLPPGTPLIQSKWPPGMVITAIAGGITALSLVVLVVVQLFGRKPAETKKVPENQHVAEAFLIDPADQVDVNPVDELPPSVEVDPATNVMSLPAIASPSDGKAEQQVRPEPAPAPDDNTRSPPAKPTTESPPSQSTPAKRAPPLKPLEGFAHVIALPAVESNKPFKLGPVKVPDDNYCVVYLLGGTTACRERHQLYLVADENSERDWEIRAQLFNQPQEEIVAKLAIRDQALWLTWTEEALENPAATSLANCGLKISAGPDTHNLSLRKSATTAAIPITYERETYDWELLDAPRTENVQVEFSVVSPKTLPRPRFIGSASVPVSNGRTTIEFGLKAGEKFLELQLDTKLDSRGVHVSVSPWVQVSGQDRPLALTPANVERLQESLAKLAAPLAAQVKAMGSSKSNAAARGELNRQLANIRRAQGELKQLVTLKRSFETQCHISAKVNYVADDLIVELLKTK